MSSRWTDRLRHTLGFRVGLWYALLFVAGSVVLLALTYGLLSSSLKERDHEIVRSTLERYALEYGRGGLGQLIEAVASDRVTGRQEGLFVRVLGRGAEAVFLNLPGGISEFDLSQLGVPSAPGAPGWARVPGRGRPLELEVASLLLPDGTLLQVGKSTESRAELLERFRAVSLGVFGSIVAIALVGGALLTRAALRPVRDLIGVVQGLLRTGQMKARVPVRGQGDPLDELSLLFNTMLDRIETLIAGLRGSLDNVAHDLRTPLTRLRGIAETALRSDDPAAHREALADCLEEVERVAQTLDTLMDVSEAETGTMALRREPVEMGPLLQEVVALFADIAEDKGVALAASAPAGLRVTADRSRLRQVVANLVDNAIKYTPGGGRVELVATAGPGVVVIVVRDDGVGIPAEDLPRVFDRLYRGDRSRSARGLGLGLSLVRAIVRAHGGEVRVDSAPGRGSTFTIDLPAEPITPL